MPFCMFIGLRLYLYILGVDDGHNRTSVQNADSTN